MSVRSPPVEDNSVESVGACFGTSQSIQQWISLSYGIRLYIESAKCKYTTGYFDLGSYSSRSVNGTNNNHYNNYCHNYHKAVTSTISNAQILFENRIFLMTFSVAKTYLRHSLSLNQRLAIPIEKILFFHSSV